MSNRYPILVQRMTNLVNLRLACRDCEHTWDAANPEAFIECVEAGHCPICGSSDTLGAFEQGMTCPNCRKLVESLSVGGHCSRACLLQSEYKASLGKNT